MNEIFRQAQGGDRAEEGIYAKGTDFETKIREETTLGMTILTNVADLGNNIKKISEDTGVDINTVQMAIGLMISGPVRLVVEYGKSMAIDSVAGEYIAKGMDTLANSLTAAAHDTSTTTIENWINSEKIKEIEQSNSENKENELRFADEVQKNKQGAEYLINAAAGVIGVGVGKGVSKGKDGDLDVSQAGFDISLGGKKDSVQALDVGSYNELKSKAVVGDGLEHDHIPSFAALKKAKENELGRDLTPSEIKTLYNEATTIEVTKDVHKAGRTYAGKNTSEQIAKDAQNLCEAQKCDLDVLRRNLENKGYDRKSVDDAIQNVIDRNKDKGIE